MLTRGMRTSGRWAWTWRGGGGQAGAGGTAVAADTAGHGRTDRAPCAAWWSVCCRDRPGDELLPLPSSFWSHGEKKKGVLV